MSEEEIRRLVRTVGEVVNGAVLDDFRCIQSFQKVALGQSTLHWWAAFLGGAREIYFPRCDRGRWGHPEPAHLAHEPGHYGIDLRVDETRYIYDW